eukprot:357078-Prymnesium_polylepis.1
MILARAKQCGERREGLRLWVRRQVELPSPPMETDRQLGPERAARCQPPDRMVRVGRHGSQRGRPHGSDRPHAVLRAGASRFAPSL